MTKVILKIEIVLDECDAEEVGTDIQKLYWGHRIGMHSYKSRTEEIPESKLPLRSGESESSY